MEHAIFLIIFGLSVASVEKGLALDKNADKNKDVAKSLAGIWQVTKHVGPSGKPASNDGIREFTFEFKENKMVMRINKDDPGLELLFKTDPTKSPMWFDRQKRDLKALGIYRFTEDGLEICMAIAFEEEPTFRPSKFKASEKSILFVLKKKK